MFYLHLFLFASIPFLASAQSPNDTFLQKKVRHYPLGDHQIPDGVCTSTQVDEPWNHWDKGPVANLKVATKTTAGVVWLRSDQGAARFDPAATHRWDRWQYFAGKSWLQDNSVSDIFVDPSQQQESVWICTRTGVSNIVYQATTLSEKAQHYEQITNQYHIRKGFVARSVLTTPGDITSATHSDTDNDGLWTAMYLAAEAYRFAATGQEEARINARRSLHALMKLETIDPVPGFYARTYRTFDEPLPHQDNGEWHPVGDGLTEWKGDTSSDETVGHYYGYALYFDLVADLAEKEAIRTFVRRITDYMINNNYELLDIDGKPTRWGRWSEDYYQSSEGDYEKALRSMEILSFLKTAYHITGDEKYQKAYLDLVARKYALFTLEYRRWGSVESEINFSDDELYFLSVFPLLMYEKDPALRAIYLDGLRFTWSQVQPESNPLWNYIAAAAGAGPLTDELAADALRTLKRSPWVLIRLNKQNSERIDVRSVQSTDRHGRGFLTRVLAPDERPLHKHNGNPYQADDNANGSEMMEPTFWLLPYWMGRYYGWLE